MSTTPEHDPIHNAIDTLARAYFKVLRAVDWNDPLVVGGLREGLNKFLSNAHLAYFRGKNKYHKTHWISQAALIQIQSNSFTKLVFEHIVPKNVYIQSPCETRARNGTLTLDFILETLKQHWQLATVTADEDKKLARRVMPVGWDGKDMLARYRDVGVTLLPNPYFSPDREQSMLPNSTIHQMPREE